MAKIKKTKEKNKSENSTATRVSKRLILKAKKIEKPEKSPKKITTDEQIVKTVIIKKKNSNKPQYSEEQFKKGITALLQYIQRKERRELFIREKQIFLQIEAIKIPHCPNRRIRFLLQHTLLTEKQEVCLIVPDLKKGRSIDHEPTIEHYEELLRTQKVQSIKRIIPIRQLRVEYDQFELKRRLCGYYDYFLVAGNISGHVLHLMGKTFIEKRKAPIPIKIEAPNLNEVIENALKKVTINLHSKGMSFIVPIGHSEMTKRQLVENLVSVCDNLNQHFPGGFKNIRSLHIKTEKSIALPIYFSLRSSNKVPVPVIKPTRPKNYEKVTDEVTTKLSGESLVTVHPGGRIEFEKKETGMTRSQKRKRTQRIIQKKSAKLRLKREKIRKLKELKELKKLKKNGDVKDVTQSLILKTEKKKKSKNKTATEPVIKVEKIEKIKTEKIKTEKIKTEKIKTEEIKTEPVKEKQNKQKKKKSKPAKNLENGVGKTKKKDKKTKKPKQTTISA